MAVMQVIVFSRNRPAQLDLLLRSAKEYWSDWYNAGWTIIYRADDIYINGYHEVMQLHHEVQYVDEGGRGIDDFKAVVMRCLVKLDDCVMFLPDDAVFIRPFSLGQQEWVRFLADDGIACLSLRLAPHLDYCYAYRSPMAVPPMQTSNTWRWRGAQGDWGYPMSIDGHIFRTSDIHPLLARLTFSNPNQLEGAMAGQPIDRPQMLCYPESRIVNLPLNRVQTENQNRHENCPPEWLLHEWYEGRRISMKELRGLINKSVHWPMVPKMEVR